MYHNKVMICGVDTSKLPLLKEKEKEKLLKRVHAGDQAAREILINGNLRLVLSVIQRFTGRGENPDDLFQVGCIGLIKSIDHFDITQDVRFSTYAVPMVIECRNQRKDVDDMIRKTAQQKAILPLSALEQNPGNCEKSNERLFSKSRQNERNKQKFDIKVYTDIDFEAMLEPEKNYYKE